MADGKYAWKIFLHLRPNTRLLVVDDGLGSLTDCLARHVDLAICVCPDTSRLQTIKPRLLASRKNTKLLFVNAAIDRPLPIAAGSIDCLVLDSGVLERIGRHKDRARYLRALGETLRPGGQLFFRAANRWGLERDEGDSAGSPQRGLVSAFGNLYTFIVGLKNRLTVTSSLRGYRRMLQESGFATTDFLGLVANNDHMYDMLPAHGSFPEWSWRAQGSWKTRLKKHPLLVPTYGVIAHKKSSREFRVVDDILDAARSGMASRAPSPRIEVMKYETTGKAKVIAFTTQGGRQLIVKIPLNDVAISLEDQNASMLNLLTHDKLVSGRIPEPLTGATKLRQTFYVESALQGTPIRELINGTERYPTVRAAFEFLKDLNPTGSYRHMELSGDLYANLVESPISRVRHFLKDNKQRSALDDFLRERLYGRIVPIGKMHGDFSVSNILFDRGHVNGVFDWEAGSVDGAPGVDAICLLLSINAAAKTLKLEEPHLQQLVQMQWPAHGEMALLEDFYVHLGVSKEIHEATVVLFWLHTLTHRLRLGLEIRPQEVDQFVVGVIRELDIGK